jgi:hypothetical protein
MPRHIDADAAGRYLIGRFGVFGNPSLEQIIDALADFTDKNTADVAEVKPDKKANTECADAALNGGGIMNGYNEKIKLAENYIDAVYRIESMQREGIAGLYGLEMRRIDAHKELCNAMNVPIEQTKDICLRLDFSIGMSVDALEKDFDFYIEKYAQKLIALLGALPKEQPK